MQKEVDYKTECMKCGSALELNALPKTVAPPCGNDMVTSVITIPKRLLCNILSINHYWNWINGGEGIWAEY